MRLRAGLLGAALVLLGLGVGPRGHADIYKYKKPNGSVVYTDKLSDLPPDRREYYNKIREEREQREREAQRNMTPEQRQAQELEKKRRELQQSQADTQEKAKRQTAIDQELAELQKKSKAREDVRLMWQRRMKDARDRLEKLLAEQKRVTEEYEQIAIKPSFTLLPGEADKLEGLKTDMDRLEQEIDKQVEEVEVKIPEEARKAGIPPGYLR